MLLLLDLVLKGAMVTTSPPIPPAPNFGGNGYERRHQREDKPLIINRNNDIIIETLKMWTICH